MQSFEYNSLCLFFRIVIEELISAGRCAITAIIKNIVRFGFQNIPRAITKNPIEQTNHIA